MRNRREPRPRRPCEAPPTQVACQRGVRGPARRMETSPAPGRLWFLSPAGKELVRPQTHETLTSCILSLVRVPPPLCLPIKNIPFAADRAAATLRRGETEPLRPLHGHLPFQGRLFSTCSPKGMPRAKRVPHPLRLPAPKHRPSLKTERFQRGRSCGTVGNPVRGAPARLHRHKPLVRGGSGGRRAAWNPRRPPAAFGSFPLRERNSCVRRHTKLPHATPCPPPVCREP